MKWHWQFNLTSMKLYYNYCYLSLSRQALSSSPAEGEAAWRRKNGENGKFRLFPGCCSPSQPKHKTVTVDFGCLELDGYEEKKLLLSFTTKTQKQSQLL